MCSISVLSPAGGTGSLAAAVAALHDGGVLQLPAGCKTGRVVRSCRHASMQSPALSPDVRLFHPKKMAGIATSRGLTPAPRPAQVPHRLQQLRHRRHREPRNHPRRRR